MNGYGLEIFFKGASAVLRGDSVPKRLIPIP